MKIIYAILLFVFVSLLKVMAQNQAPQLSQVQLAMQSANQGMITYQVFDPDLDSLEVKLLVSFNGGSTYSSYPASGDIGFPIMNGAKSINFTIPNPVSGITPMAKLVVTDRKPIPIAQIIAQIDSNTLKQLMTFFAQPRHYNQNRTVLNAIRDSIAYLMVASRLHVDRQTFSFGNYPATNVIGRKSGLRGDSLTYIVDAHFDGVQLTPGADDNASGVVGMLAVAQAFSNYHFLNNINFIGFDLEEVGLIGSQQYVQTGILPQETIGGVLNLEMIGYYDEAPNTQQFPAGFNLLFPAAYNAVVADSLRGNFITNVANVASNPLKTAFDSCAAVYVPSLKVISIAVPGNGQIAPDLRRSDHSRFWDANIQALMLTNSSEFRNTRYHTPADSAQTLNYTFMQAVVKATAATLAQLAKPVFADEIILNLPNISTNIHKHNLEADVKVFPNPNDGRFQIALGQWHAAPEKAIMRLFNLQGKVVWESSIMLGAPQTIQVQITQKLTSGNYILVVEAHDCSHTQVIQLHK